MRLRSMLLCVVLGLAGCARSVTEPAEVIRTMYVAPHQVDCKGMVPQRCMLVRYQPDEPWQWFYSHIEGFTYEPDFHYILLVRERTIVNPPQDGSSREWRLIAVLEKVPDPG